MLSPDHLIVNIWTLLTRSDVIWALVLGAGCERGSAILLRKAKTERGFHLFGIFSLFPQLGGCARELKYGTKALTWEFGGPTRRGLHNVTLQNMHEWPEHTLKWELLAQLGPLGPLQYECTPVLLSLTLVYLCVCVCEWEPGDKQEEKEIRVAALEN